MRRLVSFITSAVMAAGFVVIGSPLVAQATCTPNWTVGHVEAAIANYTNSSGQPRKTNTLLEDLVDQCGHIQFSSQSIPDGLDVGIDNPHWAYAGLQVFENAHGIFDSYAFSNQNPPNGIDENTPVWTCHAGSDYVFKDTQTTNGRNYLLKSTWTPNEAQAGLLTLDTGVVNCNVG